MSASHINSSTPSDTRVSGRAQRPGERRRREVREGFRPFSPDGRYDQSQTSGREYVEKLLSARHLHPTVSLSLRSYSLPKSSSRSGTSIQKGQPVLYSRYFHSQRGLP